jgi:hypothetical protein
MTAKEIAERTLARGAAVEQESSGMDEWNRQLELATDEIQSAIDTAVAAKLAECAKLADDHVCRTFPECCDCRKKISYAIRQRLLGVGYALPGCPDRRIEPARSG